MEAIGEARVEWMSSSDIQASDEEVFNYTTVLPIKGKVNPLNPCKLQLPPLRPNSFILMLPQRPNLQPCLLNPSLSIPTINRIIVSLFAIILSFTNEQD